MSQRIVLMVSGLLMLLAVVAYATTMTVNIEPNKEGVIDKSRDVNIVVKLSSELVIDKGQIAIEWNGQDITQACLEASSSQFNDAKTEITFYYPINATALPQGQNTIAASAGNGKWYESILTIQALDDTSLHFAYSSLLPSSNTIESSQLKNVRAQSTKDTTKPVVKSMSVDPSTLYLGDKVKISYKVTDNSALKQVELWYKKAGGDWQQVYTKSASGTSASGSFDHKPSKTGTNYYGIHVVDKAGNWNSEGSAGPKSVSVKAPDTTKPVVKTMSASPSSITLGQEVTISYTVKDNEALKQVELWVLEPGADWKNPSGKINGASGTSSAGSFKHTPSKTGTTKYGIHVVDKAGNWNSEGSAGPKSVTVSAPPTFVLYPLSANLTTVENQVTLSNPFGAQVFGKTHTGQDIIKSVDSPVYSLGDGVIKLNNTNKNTGNKYQDYWDSFLVVYYPSLGRCVYYGHLVSSLQKDTLVTIGKQLGTLRGSYNDKQVRTPSADHLHLGIKTDCITSGWGYTTAGTSVATLQQQGWRDPLPFMRGQ